MSNINQLFNQPLKVINIGLPSFYKDLKRQKIKVINVDFRPTAGGNQKMMALLSKLR